MSKNTRFFYFIVIVFVIILGIFSRKIEVVPMFIGDILYAVMVYFGMRMLFVNDSFAKNIVFATLFCFGIEFLQLYVAQWLLDIRRTTLGHYALGQGFLWSDLGYYTLGILTAFLFDFIIVKKINFENVR